MMVIIPGWEQSIISDIQYRRERYHSRKKWVTDLVWCRKGRRFHHRGTFCADCDSLRRRCTSSDKFDPANKCSINQNISRKIIFTIISYQSDMCVTIPIEIDQRNCSETALKLLKRFNWILSKNSRLEKGLPWQTCHWMWPASWTACRQTFSNEPECFDRTPRSRRVGPVRWRKDEPSRRRWTCSRRSNAGRERRRPIAAKCSTLPLNAQGSWPRRFLRDGLHPRSARKSPRLSIKFIMISLIHLIFF